MSDEDQVTQAVLSPLPKFMKHIQNGGAHPWNREPGVASTLAVFNASAKPQMLNMNLGADGIVWKTTVTIQP